MSEERKFYLAAQNDIAYIIYGEAPALNNDYPDHDADRVAVAKVYDEDLAKKLLALANQLYPAI